MSDTDEAHDNVIKFSDHARSHFVATETDRAAEIFEREMQRRLDNLQLDEADGATGSLAFAWQDAKRMIREHCETYGLDANALVQSMDESKPGGGLLDGYALPTHQVKWVRALREELVGDAFRANVRYCHARADAGPMEANGQPKGREAALVFAALCCEVLDRFAPDRMGDDPPGCPMVTINRLADHWLTCEQGAQDD